MLFPASTFSCPIRYGVTSLKFRQMTANILRRFSRARSYSPESPWPGDCGEAVGTSRNVAQKSVFVLVRAEAGCPFQVLGSIGF
jgi:hypothetical protein